jgi:predicted Rossmann-fold nucleotide-binding protein
MDITKSVGDLFSAEGLVVVITGGGSGKSQVAGDNRTVLDFDMAF